MAKELSLDALKEVDEDLGWNDIVLLSLIGVAGGVLGQLIFDVWNASTGGLLNGYLISILVTPLNHFAPSATNYNFWPSLNISIFLFRWILGSGAIGLSLGLAMKFKVKKVLYMFALGCLVGMAGWLATSYFVDLAYGKWLAYVATPFTIEAVLPCMLIGSFLSLSVSEFRNVSLFFRFLFAGFLGGLVGKYIEVFFTAAMAMFLFEFRGIFETGINPVRLTDALFVMFLTNLFCLIFLKGYLRKKIEIVKKADKIN